MPNPTISSLTLPVKNPSTGEVTNVTYDLPSGGSITVDSEISSTSENPVQNKVIYSALGNKADTSSLGTAAAKDVPSSGNASTTQVVMGNDSRLSDARSASDVYDWAKAATKPTYTASEVGLGNVGNFKAVSTVASQGLSSTEQSNARANIGAGTSNFSGSYTDLSNKPTLGTAASKDVPTSGNASSSQVVMGNDSRLSDARTPTSHTHTKSEITDFPSLATVATSGSYNDLSNKPTIPSYNFSGTSFTSSSSLNPVDCNNATSNGVYYYTSNGPAQSLGATTNDGALYVEAYSDIWVCQIAQDYRTGRLFTRSKSNGAWTAWKALPTEITDSISTTSSTIAASATAVKSAYDLANGKANKPTVLSATLAANATQVIISGLPSSGNNLIEFFTSVPGLDYSAISVSGTTVTLTYEAQSTDTTVYAVITEVTS